MDMDIIEKTTGASLEDLQEHDWPRGESVNDYFVWPCNAPRGSWRLAAGLILDAVFVKIAWRRVSKLLRRSF
jgi:hypothetical protein